MIPRIPLQRRKELQKEFDSLGLFNRSQGLHSCFNMGWGGYTSMRMWPGSCGNKEWISLDDAHLPSFTKTHQELAYWITLIRRAFRKYRLGNCMVAIPTKAHRDEFMREYLLISKAIRHMKLPLVARSKNPNYRDHWQEVYLLFSEEKCL